MTTNNATSIQEIHTAAATGARRRTEAAVAKRGVDALADVSRGLFGGATGQRARTPVRMPDDTVEIAISRVGRSPLASAA